MINKKIIIGIITLLIIIPLTIGVTWEQYTPSPTTNTIEYITTLSNGKAFGFTTNGANFIFYDENNWSEIPAPNAGNTSGRTLHTRWSSSTGTNVYLFYYSGSEWINTTIVQFNTQTRAYTRIINYTTFPFGGNPTNSFAFICEKTTNDCHLSINGSGTSNLIYRLINNDASDGTLVHNSTTAFPRITRTNSETFYGTGTMTGTETILEWNGVSWVDRSGTSLNNQEVLRQVDITSSKKIICSLGIGIYGELQFYNITTGTYLTITVMEQDVGDFIDCFTIGDRTYYGLNKDKTQFYYADYYTAATFPVVGTKTSFFNTTTTKEMSDFEAEISNWTLKSLQKVFPNIKIPK